MLLPCFSQVRIVCFAFGLLDMSPMTMTMTNNNNNNNKALCSSSSSIKIEEQGIMTILDSNINTTLRRTLSADMSSKKWMSENNSNIGESLEEEQVLHSKSLEAEAERERLEIWSSIQRKKKEEEEKTGGFDTWSSIISLKGKDEISKSLPVTPYVHPLVKRSKSSLSEKSLEICTESLGSETGSEGLLFSSYPSSETGEAEEEEQQKEEDKVLEAAFEEEQEQEQEEELQESNYNYAATKKVVSPPRAFPPPLPSLAHQQTAAPSLHMCSHRDNGRLVLQAVSVPSLNNFSVQRQEGRLVLTFANHHDGVEEMEEECFGGFEEEEEEEEDDSGEGEEGKEYESEEEEEGDDDGDVKDVMEMSSGISSSVHRLALMMNKPIELVNRNPNWSQKFNEITNFEDVNVVPTQVAQSLPPRPRLPRLIPSSPPVAAASFNFNAYEYYWRTKPASKSAAAATTTTTTVSVNTLHKDKDKHQQLNNDLVSNEQQQLLVLRGKNGDYLVHNVKTCKDSRRSFLFWEPYCIATS